MLFNSFSFLIFFPIVTAVFFILPHRFRWVWLLAASCFFYMFFIPAYILILFITILIDYTAGILIERTQGRKRKIYLAVSIISTCLVLFIFKYYNFFIDNFNSIADLLHWNYSLNVLMIILPIGLSFHTFQSLSYVIEVYRGRVKAEKHFGIYSLFVMFYPQLVAGPIERPQNMLPQFYEKKKFDYERAVSGLRQMLLGLFKKIFIADRLAVLVGGVYGNPADFHGFPLMLATILFAFQIYCDFSGYSDIALGSARVMGFKLMDNFDRPYFARSIGDFWRRWHISLSSWFRDYVYIPLGGNRVPKIYWMSNVLIVFLISGLWHGANWTYVVWGGLHGVFIIGESAMASFKNKIIKTFNLNVADLVRYFGVFITFILVSFAWIFFRANSIGEAVYVVENLFVGIGGQFNHFFIFLSRRESFSQMLSGVWPGASQIDLMIVSAALLGLIIFESKPIFWRKVSEDFNLFRWFVYYAVIILILFFGVFDHSQFIYFQF